MARKKKSGGKKSGGRPAVLSLGRAKKSSPKVRMGRGAKGSMRKTVTKSTARGRRYK